MDDSVMKIVSYQCLLVLSMILVLVLRRHFRFRYRFSFDMYVNVVRLMTK